MLLTSTYPMWYNVIPPFLPLDPGLYPTYQIGTKGLNSSIFRNYTCYVLGNVYLVFEQHVVPLTYIFTVVQQVTSKDRQHVQQHVTTLVLTTVHVTTSLPTHIPKGSITNHQPPNGG
jgi:hypothetical protein